MFQGFLWCACQNEFQVRDVESYNNKIICTYLDAHKRWVLYMINLSIWSSWNAFFHLLIIDNLALRWFISSFEFFYFYDIFQTFHNFVYNLEPTNQGNVSFWCLESRVGWSKYQKKGGVEVQIVVVRLIHQKEEL